MRKKLLSPLWLTVILIVAIVFGFLFWNIWEAKHYQPISWATYTSPSGDFSVYLPGTPEVSLTHDVTAAGQPFTTEAYAASSEDGVFQVNKYAYDTPFLTNDPEKQMRSVLETAAKSVRGTLVSSNYHTYKSHPATDFLIKTNDQFVKGRIIITSPQVEYYLAYDYTSENDDEAMYATFINSFELQ